LQNQPSDSGGFKGESTTKNSKDKEINLDDQPNGRCCYCHDHAAQNLKARENNMEELLKASKRKDYQKFARSYMFFGNLEMKLDSVPVTAIEYFKMMVIKLFE
jgi:hypothetical protein